MQNTLTLPEHGTRPERIGGRLRSWPPAAVTATVGVVGFVVVAAVIVALGLLLTKVLTPGPVARWDEGVDQWFAARRTTTWNTVTDYASILAGTGTVLAIGGVTAVILAIKRLWWELSILVVGFFIELSAFMMGVLLVDRARPHVPHMDPLPTTSSYPSGHTAATIVLYVGVAMIISAHHRSRALHALLWVIALALVVLVGFSRVYRGMHHPTDVLAGVIVGTGALVFSLMAVRAGRAASDDRHAIPSDDASYRTVHRKVA
jgi:membrane-associated phospholipid phosphatase